MSERLSNEVFWGHLEVMGRIIRFLYELSPFDKEDFDFYDLFYITKDPGTYTFKHGNRKFKITVSDDKDRAVGFEGRWYRDFADFCQNAEFNGEKFTSIYDVFYDWEVAA